MQHHQCRQGFLKLHAAPCKMFFSGSAASQTQSPPDQATQTVSVTLLDGLFY